MRNNREVVFEDLQQLIEDLEKLLAASSGDARTHAEQAVTNWRKALQAAQDRLESLQDQTRKRVADAVRTAQRTLQDNPWKSLAIVAATGFLLGLALHSRERPAP